MASPAHAAIMVVTISAIASTAVTAWRIPNNAGRGRRRGIFAPGESDRGCTRAPPKSTRRAGPGARLVVVRGEPVLSMLELLELVQHLGAVEEADVLGLRRSEAPDGPAQMHE